METQDIQNDTALQLKGVTMAATAFRHCIFILDELLSCYDCFQFLAPVPLAAVVYHTEIKKPMDFRTLENNLYENKYKEYNDFAQDLELIWSNARQFHRSFDLIYQQAENLNKRYIGLEAFIQGGPRPFYLASPKDNIESILASLLPEEKITPLIEPTVVFPMYKELEPPKKSNLYFVQALSEQDCATKKLRGFSNVRILFQHLNSAFFQYMAEPIQKNRVPLPRFYIAKNRTLLNEAGRDADGALAVLYNVQIVPMNKDLYRLQATVVISEPMGETHGFDDTSMDKSENYEFCPKAWLKLRVLKVVENVNAVINADMDRSFFKKVYNTYKLSSKIPGDPKKVGDNAIAKEFVYNLLNPVSSNSPLPALAPMEATPTLSTTTVAKATKSKPRDTTPQKAPGIPSITAVAKTVQLKQSDTPVQEETSTPLKITMKNTPIVKTTKAKESPITKTPTKPKLTTSTPNKPSPPKKSTPEIMEQSPKAKQPIVTSTSNKAPNESSSSSDPKIRLVLTQPRVINVRKSDSEESSDDEAQIPKKTTKPIKTSQFVDSSDDEDADSDGSSSPPPEAEEWYSTGDEESVNTETRPLVQSGTTTASSSMADNIESQLTETNVSFERYMDVSATKNLNESQYYINASNVLWNKLRSYAKEKKVPVVDIKQYVDKTSSFPNAEGFFKHVYYLKHDPQKVVQTFRRMTITQRITEIASLLSLKGLPHMGQITEVLQESHGEIIGLSMQRYQKTLKQYTHAHSHHRLTAYQKMDLVIQMLQCMETIHKAGLAHRDLSEVNFMVNKTSEKLRDGSPRAELFLIDFGKSAFTRGEDVRRWWIEHPTGLSKEYSGEVVPLTKLDLDIWCQQLPWVRSKPDHGYRLYRSVQTLPRSRTDTEDLPWLIDPLAEDMYSIGTIIWKVFSETEPWYGILDTDLKGLRETVSEDYRIERALEREVSGKLSKQLLLKFLKVSPEQRESPSKILHWLKDMSVQNRLIAEWEEHAPVGRQKRHAKTVFRYDEDPSNANEVTRKKQKTISSSSTPSSPLHHPLVSPTIPTEHNSHLSRNQANVKDKYKSK